MRKSPTRNAIVLMLFSVFLAAAVTFVLQRREASSPDTTGAAMQATLQQERFALHESGAPDSGAVTGRNAANFQVDPDAIQARETERLFARFRAEPRDPRWAARTEQDITEAMARALANNELAESPPMTVDCRSQTCRIGLRSTEKIDSEIAAQWLTLEIAGTLPRAQTVTLPGAGEPETFLFASR